LFLFFLPHAWTQYAFSTSMIWKGGRRIVWIFSTQWKASCIRMHPTRNVVHVHASEMKLEWCYKLLKFHNKKITLKKYSKHKKNQSIKNKWNKIPKKIVDHMKPKNLNLKNNNLKIIWNQIKMKNQGVKVE
jgi:hypothetical protein